MVCYVSNQRSNRQPNPENRIARIQEAIDELFPNGIPAGLEK